jgi:hypothetical protein
MEAPPRVTEHEELPTPTGLNLSMRSYPQPTPPLPPKELACPTFKELVLLQQLVFLLRKKAKLCSQTLKL